MFRIGQKVVCIRDAWATHLNEFAPRKDEIYTIRGLIEIGGEVGIRLREIANEPRAYCDGTRECAFNAKHFRPLVTRKTDISIFKKMLEPNRVKELAGRPDQ